MRLATITRALATVLVLLSALPALGTELEISERTWIRQCVDSLASDNERVRTSGGAALTSFGIECVPFAVTLSKKLTSDASWARLGRALDAMGPIPAADAVDASRSEWPREARDRLSELVTALRAGTYSSKPLGVGGTSPPAIERAVREILESFRGARSYRSPNPGVKRLVGLGRPAVPALIASLVREAESDADDAQGFVDAAARDALEKLCTDDDAPALIAALERGASVASAVLQDIDTPAVTDALVAAVSRHQVTHDVIEAIQVRAGDERVPKVVTRYLAEANGTFVAALGPACLLVADAGYDNGLVAIRPYLTGDLQIWDRRSVAEAAAILGDRKGLALLVTILADDSVPEERGGTWERHRAGVALNRLTGQTFYEPLSVSGLPVDLAGWRRNRLRPGDLAAGAKGYSGWWSANDEVLEYVPASRTWRAP